jgi:hypothetical protein
LLSGRGSSRTRTRGKLLASRLNKIAERLGKQATTLGLLRAAFTYYAMEHYHDELWDYVDSALRDTLEVLNQHGLDLHSLSQRLDGQTALDRLPTFATYEGTQQVERLLRQPERSELPAVTKQQVPVGRQNAPLSVLVRIGTNQYVAKVYRRLRRGLELRCEATGLDHCARAALNRADCVLTDQGMQELEYFLRNYDAICKRQAKRRTARKQVTP